MKRCGLVWMMVVACWCGAEAAVAEEMTTEQSPQEMAQIADPEMDQLRQEARRLGQEFLELFGDAAGLSQQVLHSLAGDISTWITENYPKISREKQEYIRRFVTRMKEKYATTEKQGLRAMREVLKDFVEILEQLEEGRETAPAPGLEKEPAAEPEPDGPVRL